MIGTGAGIRDFFYISDAQEAICRYIECSIKTKSPRNISSGQGTSIKTLINYIAKAIDFKFDISWDGDSMQDGVAYKVLDNSKMSKEIGTWNFVPIDNGIKNTVKYVKDNFKD